MTKRSFIPRQVFGRPNPKHLSKWIYDLDLDRFNILVRKPIDVVNFVIEHMTYTKDSVSHGVAEYWLQNAEDVYTWLFDRRMDDCDGSAIAVASILHSVGNTNIRLALGRRGNSEYVPDADSIRMNHAYCLLQTGWNKYLLLDAVGDLEIEWLDDIDFCTNYYTLVSASADGRIWYHNSWADECVI
jgi:hypothetical protein